VGRAQVRLAVDVDAHGHVTGAEVLAVNPRDEAFAHAARACAARMRFAAAKASDGERVRSRATLELSFERR
jgi:TonB family protein